MRYTVVRLFEVDEAHVHVRALLNYWIAVRDLRSVLYLAGA